MDALAVGILEELDALRYFLEEAHRRAGSLARNDEHIAKEFGRSAHSQLTGLIRILSQTEEVLRELAEVGSAQN